MKEKIKRSAEKLVGFWTSSRTGTAAGIVFMLSMLPILYLGLYNRATGDDFWYGVHTYRGLQENGIIGALKGSFQTVAEFYQSWQGTWFTMFLFTLSPHHFHPAAYMITVFLSMGMLCGSFALLADFYLVKKLKFTRGAATVIVCTLLYLAIQYIPRTTSGIFWFNGVMHYSVPFLLASLAIVHSHKFLDAGRKKDYIISLVCFILLGGGSYLAPVAATLAVFFIMLAKAVSEAGACKDRKKLFLSFKPYLMIFAAFFLELIGLIVSFLAPGNKVRGGEEFGMDLKWALQCIYGAIDRGIYLGEDYFKNNLVIVIAFILLAVLIWGQLWRTDRRENAFRFPLFFVIYMNGIYWASYVPEIYSRSDVSGGVPNTYFHFFLIVTLANVIYVHGWVQDQLIKYWKRKAEK